MDVTQQRKRPFLLGLFAFVLSGQVVVLPIVFIAFLLIPSDSPVNFNGVDVPMGEVRLEMLATMVIWFALAGFVGPGLWKGRPTARHVAFGMYAGSGLVLMLVQPTWSNLFCAIFGCLAVGGYLYAKPNVRTFFESYQATQNQ